MLNVHNEMRHVVQWTSAAATLADARFAIDWFGDRRFIRNNLLTQAQNVQLNDSIDFYCQLHQR